MLLVVVLYSVLEYSLVPWDNVNTKRKRGDGGLLTHGAVVIIYNNNNNRLLEYRVYLYKVVFETIQT